MIIDKKDIKKIKEKIKKIDMNKVLTFGLLGSTGFALYIFGMRNGLSNGYNIAQRDFHMMMDLTSDEYGLDDKFNDIWNKNVDKYFSIRYKK